MAEERTEHDKGKRGQRRAGSEQKWSLQLLFFHVLDGGYVAQEQGKSLENKE